MKHILFILLFFTLSTSYSQCRYLGLVDKITDGDTFTTTLSLGYKTYRSITVRMADMNAPEMKGKDSTAGQLSKRYLSRLILKKFIYLERKERQDKYGRYINTVYLSATDTLSVNLIMINKGYAKRVKY